MVKKMVSYRLDDDKLKKIDYICEQEYIKKSEFLDQAIDNQFYKIVQARSVDEKKKAMDLKFIKELHADEVAEASKILEDIEKKLNNGQLSDEMIKAIVEVLTLKGGEK